MAKFEIVFTHTERTKYKGTIEAENIEEAQSILEEEGFDSLEDFNVLSGEGLGLNLESLRPIIDK